MIGQYYELPLRFRQLMTRNAHVPVCDYQKSIAQHLFLMINSHFGEHRFDESFGCEVWDMDFEVVTSESLWLEKVRQSVQTSVERHEKRLEDVTVGLTISLDEYLSPLSGAKGVKRRLFIQLKGRMIETGEDFAFSTNVFLSPLSHD